MANLTPFRIVLLAFFVALGIGSLIMLGAYQASVSKDSKIYGDQVVIWGTFGQQEMVALFQDVRENNKAFEVVQYREFNKDTFESELVNAIAEGRGPDLIMMSSEQMVTLRPKMLALPYETLPLRTIKDLYVDGVEIFTFPAGTYAIPFAVDPLVLYWNRDLFASNGLAEAPATWEEVVNLVVPNITVVDDRHNIIQSALAFGEYRNLVNPKAILLTLAMQSGSQMIYLNGGSYEVGLDRHVEIASKKRPLQLAMEFFTDFSNANSQLYTWNRVQQNDKNAFLAGELAMYFGLASEYRDISNKNPNLNFDVAPMPQGSTATIKRTYGNFYGFAIPKASYNPDGAYQAVLTLTSPEFAAKLASQYTMISPRRDVIAQGDLDPVIQGAMNASLIARGWLDPSAEQTDAILQEMVENVVSNRERINQAVGDTLKRIERVF